MHDDPQDEELGRAAQATPAGRDDDARRGSLLDTVVEVDWEPQRDTTRRMARRFLAQLVLAGSAFLIVALFVERVPSWMLRRADDRSSTCIEHARREVADPTACAQGVWIAVPKWVPHTRAEALEREARIVQQIEQTQLEHATVVEPEREGRDRAARALATRPDRARLIHEAGAFEIAARLDVTDQRLEGGHWPAAAALTLGDLEEARAQIVHGSFDHHRGVVRAGALACLLGERERGLELLALADRIWRGEVDVRGFADARLAIAHCGGTFEEVGLEPTRVALPWHVEAQLVRAHDPAFQAGRRGAFGRDLSSTTWHSRAGVLGASVLAATDELSPIELLAVAAGAQRMWQWNAEDVVSPHLVLAPGRYDHVPPAWIEAAAERFEAAIPLVPPVLSANDTRGLALLYAMVDTPADPQGTLRDASFILWRAAAVFRARGGDREGAASALARATAIASTKLRLILVPVELAIDDVAGALASLDAWEAAHGATALPDDRAIAAFNRALALMSLGEHASAHEAALASVESLDQATALEAYIDGFEWLLAATAIASGHLDGPLPLRDPNAEFPFVSPVSWIEAIRAGTPGDALRQSFHDERATRAALVAEVFVVEQAAALVGDPEVAADAFFATMHPSRALARARAQAARWQGDETRERAWRARAEVLERLMTDDHRVALAGLAGIW
jgi:hypothetical protein